MVARTFQKRASRPRASAWLAARDFEVEAMTLRNSFQALRRRLAPTEPETATDPVPEAYPGQHEQRLSLRLLSYWQHLRGDATFASRARIETEVIAEMWPWCFILEVPAIAERSLVTTDIRDPAALRENTLLAQATSFLAQVLMRRVPVTMGGSFRNPAGREILYRSVLLPLSDDQRTISAVLGAANCKEKTS